MLEALWSGFCSLVASGDMVERRVEVLCGKPNGRRQSDALGGIGLNAPVGAELAFLQSQFAQ
jgi:hypothetical protein